MYFKKIGSFLDELSAVVAADEEQIHFGSRLQYALNFSYRGIRIGGPVKGEDAEQIIRPSRFPGECASKDPLQI